MELPLDHKKIPPWAFFSYRKECDMVWYGMYDTPQHLKVPSLLIAFSLTYWHSSGEVSKAPGLPDLPPPFKNSFPAPVEVITQFLHENKKNTHKMPSSPLFRKPLPF